MNNNIYESFRKIQEVKKSTRSKRSASFIEEGGVSNEIIHVRLNKNIKATIIFNQKEGPDEVSILTLKDELVPENELRKGDYFSYDNVFYLVYDDVKIPDKEIAYKKQKALECNVNFTVGQDTYRGCFISSLQTDPKEGFVKNMVISANQRPVLIVPFNPNLNIGTTFKIDNRGWKIQDFDGITNRGMLYLYLIPSVDVFPAETKEEESIDEDSLYPLVEYEFDTNEAYFAAVPRIQVKSRTKDKVKFIIPTGISEVSISTKDLSGNIIEKIYKVVI